MRVQPSPALQPSRAPATPGPGAKSLVLKRPEDAEALNYLGYMLADRGSKLQDARGFLEKAVGLEPENSAFLDSLGWVHFRLGNFEQAKAFLEKMAKVELAHKEKVEYLYDNAAFPEVW